MYPAAGLVPYQVHILSDPNVGPSLSHPTQCAELLSYVTNFSYLQDRIDIKRHWQESRHVLVLQVLVQNPSVDNLRVASWVSLPIPTFQKYLSESSRCPLPVRYLSHLGVYTSNLI